MKRAPPTHGRIFSLYFLLGFGLLLPWNVICNTIPTFRAALPPSTAYFSPARYAFAAPLFFNSPQLPVQVATLLLGPARTPSARARLLGGYALQALLMLALPFALPLGTGPVLAACAAAGAATAVIEAALR